MILLSQVYAELLKECDMKIPAWFSFNSQDGINVASGDSLIECVSIADSCENVVAVGVNCTAPRFIHKLILSIRKVPPAPTSLFVTLGDYGMYTAICILHFYKRLTAFSLFLTLMFMTLFLL